MVSILDSSESLVGGFGSTYVVTWGCVEMIMVNNRSRMDRVARVNPELLLS